MQPYILSIIAVCWDAVAAAAQIPETVHFMSRDGSTRLAGYLFKPQAPGPYPAIVMLHGRSGVYSSLKAFFDRHLRLEQGGGK